MNTEALINGLLLWIAFVALVALHEYAHAWTAVRCGDDTPHVQGRLTLDPLAHIDLLGTIILPLLVTVLSATGGHAMMFGWGKPVQVDLSNFRHRRRDDILVSVAGPAMNLVLAFVILGLMKLMELAGGEDYLNPALNIARLSLFLCFFNLLPVPPLDGGHILRNVVGMSDEAYQRLGQYSFIFLLMIMQAPAVGAAISTFTNTALSLLAYPFGWRLTTG